MDTKNLKKALMSFLFMCILGVRSNAYSSGTILINWPSTVGGYEVLITLAPGMIACVPTTTYIVLQATEATVYEHLRSEHIDLIRQDLPELLASPSNDFQISIVGPGATIEGIMKSIGEWNSLRSRYGCRKLAPAATGSTGTEEFGGLSSRPGVSVFENVDAGSYPSGSDYDNAQSVFLTAPSSIDSDNVDFAFLNNVWTNEDYLIQNGLYFGGTVGSLVWTSETLYYSPSPILISYVAGNDYWFGISFNNPWIVCQYDTSDVEGYNCIWDEDPVRDPGDNLKFDINTGIWIENFNTDPDWADNMPQLQAQAAEIYLNGYNQWWSAQHKHTIHGCTQGYYPTSSAMTGSLVNGGTAYFNPEYLPLAC